MRHHLRRLGAFLALALALVSFITVLAAAHAEPLPPANRALVTTEFAAHGPDGAPGLWVWDPTGRLIAGHPGWTFTPAVLRQAQATPRERPPWPDDVTIVQVVVVAGEDGTTPEGVWVWNPYRFVGGNGSSHLWSPTWEWYTADQLD